MNPLVAVTLAMDSASYVVGSWVAVVVTLAAYSVFVIRRGKALSKRVPRESRRWMS